MLNDQGNVFSSTVVKNGETTKTKYKYDKEHKLTSIEVNKNLGTTKVEYKYDENDRIILTKSQNAFDNSTYKATYEYVNDDLYYVSHFQNDILNHKDKHISNSKSKMKESIVEEPHLNRKRIYRTKIGSI